jgi:hypothetical protein
MSMLYNKLKLNLTQIMMNYWKLYKTYEENKKGEGILLN